MMPNDSLQSAAAMMADGGIVAYPTEAVFGLGCDPFNVCAVDKLLALKQRTRAQGLILLAANRAMLAPLINLETLDTAVCKKIEQSWPGPVTWLIPATDQVPRWITGAHRCVAVRVSAHPLAAGLSRAFAGPIVSTSANVAGGTPARNAIDVSRFFDNAIDYIVDGEVGGAQNPTEIRDAVSDQIRRQA